MFKMMIIETAINAILGFLENPKNSKIKAFLLKEETQKTMADIYGKYSEFVEESEPEAN